MPTCKLWEICRFQNWFVFQSDLFKDIWEPILRIWNIQNNWFSDNRLVFFDLKDYKQNLDNYIVYPWDLVIAMSGATTWKLAINNTDRKYYLNQRVGKFTFDNDITKKWCHLFLTTKIESNLQQSAGSAIPNLSTEQIKSIEIPLPSLAVQSVIVDKLNKLQFLIDIKKQAIIKTDELTKAIFFEMFGDPLKNEQNLEKNKLDNVTIITMWQSPSGESYNLTWDWMPFFQGKAEFTDKYPIIKKRTTKPTKYAKINDILISVRAPVWDINLCNVDCCIGRWLASIRANKVNLQYLYWTLVFLKDSIADLWTWSTFKAISSSQLKSIQIILPPLPLQQKFSKIITQIEAQKDEHKEALAKLEELYQATMQESFRL